MTLKKTGKWIAGLSFVSYLTFGLIFETKYGEEIYPEKPNIVKRTERINSQLWTPVDKLYLMNFAQDSGKVDNYIQRANELVNLSDSLKATTDYKDSLDYFVQEKKIRRERGPTSTYGKLTYNLTNHSIYFFSIGLGLIGAGKIKEKQKKVKK
ncbi:MAG: hypothetical protein ABIB43_03865 [archaeon]